MTELEGYKEEAKRCRDEEHKTKVAAQEMQRKLLAQIAELTATNRTLNEASAFLIQERDQAVTAARDLTDELARLKAKYTELSARYTDLARKEHGWPWALEQLAAGHKVTHPILQGSSKMPSEVGGWIEKIGEGPRGTLYEIHESYCFSRVLDSENGWQELASKSRMSIGWTVCK